MKNESLYRGRYRVLRKLGEGGSSTVYMGVDNKSGRAVTIKRFKDAVLNGSDIVESVREETAILRKLNHTAIPKVLAVYEDSFVLEHVPGSSLEKVLKKKSGLQEKEAVRIGLELLDILRYLHGLDRPVIYRDLKPANIIVRPDGHVALIDFGAAREYRPEEAADTLNLGTCGYAAPEQYGSLGQTDDRTDIYCFGRTMTQMLSGRSVSPELLAIIDKCTRPDRQDRFGSDREIKRALQGYPKKVRIRRALKGFKLAVVAGVLAAVVTLTATYYDTVRAYAAEDARARIPAVKERLGNAGIRINTILLEEFGLEIK